MKTRLFWFSAVCVCVASVVFAGSAEAALRGLWEFEDGSNLTAATIGADLALTGVDAAVAGSGGPDTGGASLDVDDFYTVPNPIGANGGGARTNAFTLLMDIKIPAGVTGFIALGEFGSPAADDGDYFLDTDTDTEDRAGVSSEGYVPIAGLLGTEYRRLVMSFENGVKRTSYLDGIALGDHEVGDIDGRWTLGDTLDVFSDNGGGEEAETWVSNLALYDTALDADQVAALGGAGRLIVPEPGTLTLAVLFGLALSAVGLRKRLG
jgi:hypothetical protein